MSRSKSALGVLLALAMTSASALAQRSPSVASSVSGVVRDTSGAPVSQARLALRDAIHMTDSLGRFAFAGMASGDATLTVRRIGFEPREVAIVLVAGRSDTVDVVLVALAQELPGVLSEAEGMSDSRMAAFYRHRKNGSGHYFDRKEIEERRVFRMSDLVRRLPGVRIASDRYGRPMLRMGRAASGRDCPPDFWVDGVRAANMNVDDVPLVDVEALEIYKGPSGLPPEFNARLGNPGCGAIVIWTRVPG